MHPLKIITNLTPARWQEYRQLRLRALHTEPTWFVRTEKEDAELPDRVWQDHLLAAQQSKRSVMAFAQIDHKLIGMVAALIDQGSVVHHRATIVSFYVDPEFRDQDIGEQLLKALLYRLSLNPVIAQIRLTVNVTMTPIIELYEKMGFKKVGTLEKSLRIGATFYNEYLMVKFVTNTSPAKTIKA